MERFLRTLTQNKHLITMTVLCVLTVGIGSWYLLTAPDPTATEEAATVSVADEIPVRAAEPIQKAKTPVTPEPPAAEVLLPAPVKEAEEDAPPAPQPVVDNTPVTPAPPKLVVSPLNGAVLTAFAVDELVYSETFADWRTHDGIDIAAEAGTTVLAASAGTVLAVRNDDMMGTTVVIDHGDGCQTTYANLQARPTVVAGDEVSAGQIIGAVGTTAAAESAHGPHLHFSVSKNGDAIDPNTYLKK